MRKQTDQPMSDDGINWNNDPDVVLRRRYATAIYINADGDITLRQERWPDEDVCIVVPVEDGEYFGGMVAAMARAGERGECGHVRGIRTPKSQAATSDANGGGHE
jgi:hypothetical protein